MIPTGAAVLKIGLLVSIDLAFGLTFTNKEACCDVSKDLGGDKWRFLSGDICRFLGGDMWRDESIFLGDDICRIVFMGLGGDILRDISAVLGGDKRFDWFITLGGIICPIPSILLADDTRRLIVVVGGRECDLPESFSRRSLTPP